MKRFSFIILLTTLSFNINGQSPSFNTFMNPVIPGDHPDCTLTKIGNYFYTTGSSFSPTPKIYRSTDLVHWEAISQPVSNAWSLYGSNPSDGIWGGHVVFYNNKYWHFFGGPSYTMYFVTADNVEGPWSSPSKMICPTSVPGLGRDNSIFIDDDGSWYLLVKNGQENNWILQLGDDGQPKGAIYDLRWINPSPNFPYSWAEGPVMWKYKGYYYYSFARHAYGGQVVMRSQTLTSEKSSWEILGDLFASASGQSLFPSGNHCSPAVMLDDSTSWILYHSYSTNEWQGSGRQGLLGQLRYDANGKPTLDYPSNLPKTAPKLPSSGIPWMVPKSDFFDSHKLNPEWSRLGYSPTMNYSLTERPGWLRLLPKNKHNTVIKNDAEHNYSLITRVDFEPTSTAHEAGLRIMTGLQNLSAKIFSSINTNSEKVVVFQFDRSSAEVVNNFGNVIWLKLVRINHNLSGYFSGDGKQWTQVGSSVNVSTMDIQQDDYNAWTGNRQGLYVIGKSADFDFYIYRDAYTPILSGFPANQYGTKLYGTSDLDDIHNNDWALYAGVEFGNENYLRTPDSLVITASSSSSGGKVEVWLDSLDAGTKIAECEIENTGGWTTYKEFKTATTNISGRHDVYLKFIGTGTDKLFRLRSMIFISKNLDTGVSDNFDSPINSDYSLSQNYPNPFNPSTKISFNLPKQSAVTIKVYDILGRVVTNLLDEVKPAGSYVVEFNGGGLSSGIYFYRMESNNQTFTKSMMLIK